MGTTDHIDELAALPDREKSLVGRIAKLSKPVERELLSCFEMFGGGASDCLPYVFLPYMALALEEELGGQRTEGVSTETQRVLAELADACSESSDLSNLVALGVLEPLRDSAHATTIRENLPAKLREEWDALA